MNHCELCGRPWPCDEAERIDDVRVCFTCYYKIHDIGNEYEFYGSCKDALSTEMAKWEVDYVHCEITAFGYMSPRLAKLFDWETLRVLRDAKFKPDLTGYFLYEGKIMTFICEAKLKPEIGGLCQTQKYCEIIDTDLGFLLSAVRPHWTVRRYIMKHLHLTQCSNGSKIAIGIVDLQTKHMREWIPSFTLAQAHA